MKYQVLFFLLLPSMAAALPAPEPPVACAAEPLRTAYRAGFVSGSSGSKIGKQAVKGKDCAQQATVLAAVNRVLLATGVPVTPTNANQCRARGIADGLAAYVNLLNDRCPINCDESIDGTERGGIYAQAYCELAIAVNGVPNPGPFVRPATTPCGELYQRNCDKAFAETAMHYVNDNEQSCAPYVQSATVVNMRESVCRFDASP